MLLLFLPRCSTKPLSLMLSNVVKRRDGASSLRLVPWSQRTLIPSPTRDRARSNADVVADHPDLRPSNDRDSPLGGYGHVVEARWVVSSRLAPLCLIWWPRDRLGSWAPLDHPAKTSTRETRISVSRRVIRASEDRDEGYRSVDTRIVATAGSTCSPRLAPIELVCLVHDFWISRSPDPGARLRARSPCTKNRQATTTRIVANVRSRASERARPRPREREATGPPTGR